jgi:hypothetical protein
MPNEDLLDTGSMPMTEPYLPTFDTGAHYKAEPEIIEPHPPARRHRWWRRRSDTVSEAVGDEPAGDDPAAAELSAPPDAAPSGPLHPPASSITVPGRYHYLKWWQFILMVLAVWVPAGAIGAGLFYWWTHDNSAHKTPVVFVVFVYVVVSVVAGLMLAMFTDRPLVSALAIAMMSAMFASLIAAAPLYGAFYCEHSQRPCLMGVMPY